MEWSGGVAVRRDADQSVTFSNGISLISIFFFFKYT